MKGDINPKVVVLYYICPHLRGLNSQKLHIPSLPP